MILANRKSQEKRNTSIIHYYIYQESHDMMHAIKILNHYDNH